MTIGAAIAAAMTIAASVPSAEATITTTGTRAVGSAARAAGRSLHTLFSAVRVFGAASSHAAVAGRLGRRGTGVSVLCWTTGTDYGDGPIWYETSAPQPGFVPAFNLAAHYSPAVGVPHCPTPAFKERFNSLAVNLRIHTSPSVSAAIVGYLGHTGSQVTVECFARGDTIFGDQIWYRTVTPMVGYVSGRFLNTGWDPAPGVPRC